MLEGQPKEHAAGQRVHVRRAFAGQIRQIDQPIAAAGNRFHLRVHHAIGHTAQHRVPQPAQRKPSAKGRAHEIPAVLLKVIEGVRTQLLIINRRGDGREYLCAGADGDGYLSRRDDPVADCLHHLIRAAMEYFCAGFQAGFCGRRGCDLASKVLREINFRIKRTAQPQCPNQFVRPCRLVTSVERQLVSR